MRYILTVCILVCLQGNISGAEFEYPSDVVVLFNGVQAVNCYFEGSTINSNWNKYGAILFHLGAGHYQQYGPVETSCVVSGITYPAYGVDYKIFAYSSYSEDDARYYWNIELSVRTLDFIENGGADFFFGEVRGMDSPCFPIVTLKNTKKTIYLLSYYGSYRWSGAIGGSATIIPFWDSNDLPDWLGGDTDIPSLTVRNFVDYSRKIKSSPFCAGIFTEEWLGDSLFNPDDCGDYNADGKVNLADFALMANQWAERNWDDIFFESYLR
ncbi:MAG: hypothetical protein PHF37_05725 [Phycisphaerae bacterium]|nr:hypothetical protein [Phycisphaerae bacterium]